MSEFLDMKGYGIYIWPAYVIALGALWLNIWAARRQQRVAREELYEVAVELVARTLDVEIDQSFQKITGSARLGSTEVELHQARLRGDQIGFGFVVDGVSVRSVVKLGRSEAEGRV